MLNVGRHGLALARCKINFVGFFAEIWTSAAPNTKNGVAYFCVPHNLSNENGILGPVFVHCRSLVYTLNAQSIGIWLLIVYIF